MLTGLEALHKRKVQKNHINLFRYRNLHIQSKRPKMFSSCFKNSICSKIQEQMNK